MWVKAAVTHAGSSRPHSIGARTASVALLVVLALAMGIRPLVTGSALPSSVVVGVLDIAAAVLFLLATRSGSLAVVAVLSSLYPIATVVLARTFDGERCHRIQFVGFAVAATSVGLIAGMTAGVQPVRPARRTASSPPSARSVANGFVGPDRRR